MGIKNIFYLKLVIIPENITKKLSNKMILKFNVVHPDYRTNFEITSTSYIAGKVVSRLTLDEYNRRNFTKIVTLKMFFKF